MITKYLLATTLLFSQTGAMAQMISPFVVQKQVGELVEKVKRLEEEKRIRLEASNYFSHDDFYHILDTKVHDLKVIQALLFRYKADFNLIRDSQEYRFKYAREKVVDIFGTKIYNYEYNKDITYIILFLWDQLNHIDIDHAAKINELKYIITRTKTSLIFLRDLCLRNNWAPWGVFFLLHDIDVGLVVCRSNEDWDRCKKLLHALDTI